MLIRYSIVLTFLLVALQQNPGIHIDGVVMDGSTQTPLPSVSVQIAGIKTKTDKQGRFALDGVPAGKQTLIAERDGYLRARLDSRKVSGGSGIGLTVKAGEALRSLTLHIFPAGAISGRIFDSQGRPVLGANVYAFRYAYDELGGRSFLGTLSNTSLIRLDCGLSADTRTVVANAADFRVKGLATDDRGEFRIFNLDPGQYGLCIRAGSPPSFFLYPSASEWRNATIVDIEVGTDVRLNNATLPREIVAASRFGGRGADEANVARAVTAQDVRVGGTATIISTDGSSRPANEIEIALDQPGSNLLRIVSGRDGTFFQAAVPRNVLTVRSISGVPAGVCVRSFRQGERDVLRSGLSLQSSEVNFTLTLGGSEATVQGIARDSGGQKAPGALVVLVPDDRTRFELFSSTTADQDGAFQIPCAAAGSYRLYAWFALDGQAYRNADFLRQYVNAGKVVQIEKGEILTTDVTVLD